MGNITIQGDLTGDVPGGEVGGASNLTTAGAIPYVSSPGTLTQDASNLFWDSVNARLGVGTASPSYGLEVSSALTTGQMQITGTTASSYGGFNVSNSTGQLLQIGTYGASNANASETFIYAATGTTALRLWTADFLAPLKFMPGNTEKARIVGSTGNLLIGTTTDDGSNKLQVAGGGKFTGAAAGAVQLSLSSATVGAWAWRMKASNSALYLSRDETVDTVSITAAGVLTLYNETATTGSTKLVVRAGAGQSSTNLMEWQNSSGVVQSAITAGGNVLELSKSSVNGMYLGFGGVVFGSGVGTSWTSGVATSAVDLALARNAAGVLEINSGTAGTLRDILARRHQASGETVASLPAAAAGNAGTISYVTDANATTIGSTVAGGGANKVLVWSNGTAWKIFAN